MYTEHDPVVEVPTERHSPVSDGECQASSHGFLCTRDGGHDGDHEASIGETKTGTDLIAASWDDEVDQ